MLPNGDFDSEAYEDEKDCDMEEDSEEVKLIQEENNGKKVRRVYLASS